MYKLHTRSKGANRAPEQGRDSASKCRDPRLKCKMQSIKIKVYESHRFLTYIGAGKQYCLLLLLSISVFLLFSFFLFLHFFSCRFRAVD